jgi:hypothetical protein
VEPESAGGVARRSWGGDDEGVEEESPGAISAFGVPSSELETARRNRGGPPSLLLDEDEVLEVLLDELPDELPAELLELSSELELARRSLGRSGSLSVVEPEDDEPEELLEELSSELDDAARRKVGLLGFEPTVELLFELFDEDDEDELSDDLGSGFMSSVCSDASECSSVVPSRTMEMVDAL